MVAWPLESRSVSLRNFVDGMDRSISCRRAYRGDSANALIVSFLINLERLCLAAERLAGIFPLHDWGSNTAGLESPLAALFASSSALSFSLTPSWPGVHQISTTSLPCLPQTPSISSCSLSTRCWPGVPLVLYIDWITA